MFELSGTDWPSRRECVSRAGYQQGRSQPASLVLVVRGDGEASNRMISATTALNLAGGMMIVLAGPPLEELPDVPAL
jgi:hypothetical protein